MSSVKYVTDIPTEGKEPILVAAVGQVLHFRVFDGDGKKVVDIDEKKLTEQARPIEDLRKQLGTLWPPHELTESEKCQVIDAVTSIVGHTLLDTIPDEEFLKLTQDEAKRPEPTAAHVAQAFATFLRQHLRGKGLVVLTHLELLFAYRVELNLLRTLAADDDRALLLLPGRRDGLRVV